ncbi:hypothetical protein [Amycolatopsis sp. A1MSW2902]|uniref:hypothetical protein n=1 Tax=Amycolatopsis sp. A1MSW2902 TaxID=687413 RepID=UPI00307CD66B
MSSAVSDAFGAAAPNASVAGLGEIRNGRIARDIWLRMLPSEIVAARRMKRATWFRGAPNAVADGHSIVVV